MHDHVAQSSASTLFTRVFLSYKLAKNCKRKKLSDGLFIPIGRVSISDILGISELIDLKKDFSKPAKEYEFIVGS